MGFAVDRDGVETRVIHDLVDFDGLSVFTQRRRTVGSRCGRTVRFTVSVR